MTRPEARKTRKIVDATPVMCRVLVLGDVAAAEMRPVLQDVMTVFAASEIRIVPLHTGIFEREVTADWTPDLVVVCQTEPEEFSRDDVLGLIARFPVSRLVCCFGLWCESDGRNRDLWPLAVRVPARLAAMRLRRERDVIAGKHPALPLTAGREEAFAFDAAWSIAIPTCSSRQATVNSPDRELQSGFEDRLRTLGVTVGPIETDTPHAVILFDADPWNDSTASKLRQLRDAMPQAAIVALMNFARPEDVHAVTRSGADAVLAKLANLEALAVALTRLSSRDVAGTVPCGVRGRGNL